MSYFEKNKGCWAFIDVGGPKFIGRIIEKSNPIEVVKYLNMNSFITICPGFEYISRLMQQQSEDGRTALVRDSFVLNFDLSLNDELPITVKPAAIVFFDDMKPNDRKEYEDRIEDALKKIQMARMAQSGLVIADSIPDEARNNTVSILDALRRR